MKQFTVALLALLGLTACQSSGPKVGDPGLARFVGTWESAADGPLAVLIVQPDQHARLRVSTPGEKPVEYRGMCRSGSDTLTFSEDARDGSGFARHAYLFATRPDGSLAVTLEGVPMRLRRR